MSAIILVEPEGAVNIGAVCRAMVNMNAGSLVLVNPQTDPFSSEAYRFAMHASALLKDALIVPDLSTALSGYEFSVAITRRTGQWRKQDFDPKSLGFYLTAHPQLDTCLVFGRESAGLTSEEVRLCNVICSIPSHSSYPSLNLSHAVMVILYELYYSNHSNEDQPASPHEINTLVKTIENTFVEAGLFKKRSPENLMHYFRKILTRRQPEHYEILVVSNAFKRLRGSILKLKKNNQND